MKKLCILGASMIVLAFSNSANAQVRFGLGGGVNLNQNIDQYQGETVANQAKVGWHLGGLADICLANNLTLQPGLMYIQKGGLQQRTAEAQLPDGFHELKVKDKLALHYIEMPLILTYRFGVGRGNLVLGAGGYAAALTGANTESKWKYTINDEDIESLSKDEDQNLAIGNQEGDNLKRMDYGLVGNLGYEFANGWFLRGGVDAGLRDIMGDNFAPNIAATQSAPAVVNSSSRNVSYLFTLGYWFSH
ncbi:MAG: PorT family protein [Flavipsychrobacter sp.]|nr:PorT family protein [Flavipsychrobacter sp.]